MYGNSTKTKDTLLEIYINNLKATRTAKTIYPGHQSNPVYIMFRSSTEIHTR